MQTLDITKKPLLPNANADTFLVYTHVARMLAAEDIIVRWNVVGMNAPARMSYATRVLDVAPIKEDCQDTIPGLILHEIGHFLFSDNVVKKSANGRHELDIDRINEIRAKTENHHIWNIVEDGYIERKTVQKWAGALKYFRILYDNDLKMSKECTSFDPTVIILNTLQLNCIGAKWNEVHEYPSYTPKHLLKLLERARTIVGGPDVRREISNKIAVALMDLQKQIKNTAVKIIEVSMDNSVETTGGDGRGTEGVQSGMTKAQSAAAMEDFMQQEKIDSVLNADLDMQMQNQVQHDSQNGVENAGEDRKGQHDSNIQQQQQSQEEKKDQQSENDDPEVEEVVNRMQEYISDKKALLIGNNMQYLAQARNNSLEQNDTTKSSFQIASPSQIAGVSDTCEIIAPAMLNSIQSIPFLSFIRSVEQYELDRSGKKAVTLFNKKIQTSKSIAQALFQRFTTKANAINVSLTRYKQTGSLDPTRAALYKIYDDVFQRRRQAPQQINHAYVLMVDWSSSMRQDAMDLFHRIAELVHFAQLANVEIDVWLYTTSSSVNSTQFFNAKLNSTRGDAGNTLYLPSKMVHVLNTKNNNPNELAYRMFAMYLNSYVITKNMYYNQNDRITFGGNKLLNGFSFINNCIHGMAGTNIFEAVSFALTKIEGMSADKKAIMLLTDGEDNSFDTASKLQHDTLSSQHIPVMIGASQRNIDIIFNEIIYNGINIIELCKKSDFLKSVFTHGGLKGLSTYLLCEDIRKLGISVVGVSWGQYISSSMLYWSNGNSIRIQSSHRRTPVSEYTPVNNTFISKITDALLVQPKGSLS